MEIEQKLNRNGIGTERERKGNGTGMERERNRNGTGMEREWNRRTDNEYSVQGAWPVIRFFTSREPLIKEFEQERNGNGTGMEWERNGNGAAMFHFRSIPVPFPFHSHSIPVPFLFNFRSIELNWNGTGTERKLKKADELTHCSLEGFNSTGQFVHKYFIRSGL